MKYKTLLPLLLLLVMNCTTIEISSSVLAPGVIQDLDGVYYAIYTDDSIEAAATYIESRSRAIYELNSVHFEQDTYSFLNNAGAFTVENLIAIAKDQNCNYFIMMNVDEYDQTVTPNYAYTGTSFGYAGSSKTIEHGLKARLFSVADTTEIWRAVIDVTSGDYGNGKQTGNAIAFEVIDKLKRDRIYPAGFNTKLK